MLLFKNNTMNKYKNLLSIIIKVNIKKKKAKLKSMLISIKINLLCQNNKNTSINNNLSNCKKTNNKLKNKKIKSKPLHLLYIKLMKKTTKIFKINQMHLKLSL